MSSVVRNPMKAALRKQIKEKVLMLSHENKKQQSDAITKSVRYIISIKIYTSAIKSHKKNIALTKNPHSNRFQLLFCEFQILSL